MFADNLRRILQLKLIHQTELAKQLGVSRQTVNKWCAGEMPSMVRLKSIAEALDCSVDDLMLEKKSDEEWELRGLYGELSDEKKAMLLDYARYLKERT